MLYQYPDNSRDTARSWIYDGQVYPASFLARRPAESDTNYAARLAPIGVQPVRVVAPDIDPNTQDKGEPVETIVEGWIEVRYPDPLDKNPVWSTQTRERMHIAPGAPIPPGYTEMKPNGEYLVWDGSAWAVDADAQGLAVRGERDRRLRTCDTQALPDYPHPDEATRQAWLDYRQALRDLPDLDGFPWDGDMAAVPWPAEPE